MSDTEADIHKRETTRVLRPADMQRRKSDSGTIVAVLRKVSMPTILFGLLAALAGTVGVIGRGYANRIEVAEKAADVQRETDQKQDEKFQEHQRAQSGHLHSIDVQLTEMKTEQRFMKDEQRNMRAVLERIERKIDQR